VNRIVVEGLRAGYGAVSVLHDVSMEIREAELVAVLGTNGNGKSTLLNCIVGLVKPAAGRIRLEWGGRVIELTGRAPHEIVDQGVGFVPEGRRLVPNLTVEENLVLAGSGRRARAQLKHNLTYCFDTFPMLAEKRRQRASTLSGGQQQLLAIARALMTSPRVIVIDEPSVGLAPIVVDQVIAAIRDLQRNWRLTILMAEQSFFQTIDIATRTYILAHGRIIRTFDHLVDRVTHEEIRRAMLGVVR
jgi:branched-chain amino acid transport system ATP-binding protein